MSTYIGGRIIPKHAGTWDETAEYETLTIVLDEETGDSYISRKAVPAGTALDDEEYWAKSSDYSVQLKNIQDAVDVLEAQVAANVTASTDEDADYAAEVVDARVDSSGETYNSLGNAVRSVSEGFHTKVDPDQTAKVVNYENTASISVDGYVCDCTLYYEGQGYAGVFARFFGTYEECSTKKFRVIIIGTSEAEMEAIVTNRGGAWGSNDGSTGSFSLCTVSLTEDNGYMAAVDIDCSEDAWSEFAASYSTTTNGLFFCLRCMSTTETVDVSFSMYAYEIDTDSRSTWKYSFGEDDIALLKYEMKSARGDYATLSERFTAQTEELQKYSNEQVADLEERLDAQDEILKEVTDAHTDSRGYEYDTLSERISVFDALNCPKLSVSGTVAPRDNKAGTLTTGDMGAEVVNNNAVFSFDYSAYTTEYESYHWSSLNFSFEISNSVIAALTDRSALYLDIGILDADGDDSHDGETMTMGIYLNSYPAWGTTVNEMVTFTARIGKRTLLKLDEEMVENVLATGLSLYVVFYGNYLNTDTIAELDKICITAAIADASAKTDYASTLGWCDFSEQADYADKAGSAETADEADYASEAGNAATADSASNADNAEEAEYAESADFADNFFLNSPDDLLNEDGVRYSEGMDTLSIPDPPYSFSYSFQSIAEVAEATLIGSGFEQYLSFEMELSASSGQTSNQGYTKKLDGMFSFEDFFAKFQEGYADCCICTIEETNYPEESSSGTYAQKLLISYYGSSASNKVVASSSAVLEKTVLGGRTLYLWRFSFDEDVISEIAEEIEAGTFKVSWFGIWNTRKYTDDDPVEWNPIWYWQDYAFTDGSFSDDEMASFFEEKYIYWASYVNHRKLKEKFEALEEWQETVEELQESVDALQETVGTDTGKKIYGIATGTVANGDNTVTVTLDGYNYDCVMHHEGSGYVGAFFGFFGDYEDCADKQFRILVVGSSEVTLQAIVTNSRTAWGNSAGTISSLAVQSVQLTEENNYSAIIDIDFSEEKWADFVETYTASSTLYFCLRYLTATAMDTEFILCACERSVNLIDEGEYVGFEDENFQLDQLEEAVADLQESLEELQEDSDSSDTGGIVCWGDSLTAGGGWTTTLASLSGLTVYNAGTGGEKATTITARQGGDVMIINNITIPAECEAVTLATYADDGGIATQAGNTVTPLLQGGTAHVNPVMIGDVEGVLAWTGSSYSDTTGTWTFTRSEAGDEVAITRPTAIRTAYDRNRNGKNDIMIIFMGQNGGYNSDVSELIRMHRLMIDHFKGKEYVILGLSSGTASSRADYEEAMEEEFGRRFISLREYLSYPIYDEDGETIISCYGLDDAGLDATDDDITAIESGQVPSSLLSDSVHYTSDTKTVIGNLLYKKMVELGIL